jgi:hypothetical protein
VYSDAGVAGEAVELDCGNVIYPVAALEVERAEKRPGFGFPKKLRTFYREVGDGLLTEYPLSPGGRPGLAR